jgi:hypothetical protein
MATERFGLPSEVGGLVRLVWLNYSYNRLSVGTRSSLSDEFKYFGLVIASTYRITLNRGNSVGVMMLGFLILYSTDSNIFKCARR